MVPLEEPKDMFIEKHVGTLFNRILPSDRFGKEHPEYYSFINGEHRPGHNSQWCLTNLKYLTRPYASQIRSLRLTRT